MNQKIKTQKWRWVIGGMLALIIIIAIADRGEKIAQQAQVSQPVRKNNHIK